MLMLKQTAIWGGGIVGLGVFLFKFTVPTEEELLQKMSPEIRAQVERNRELRQQEQAMLMEIVKKTADSDQPIWKTGELYNPWEGTGSKLASPGQGELREGAGCKQAQERARGVERTAEEAQVISRSGFPPFLVYRQTMRRQAGFTQALRLYTFCWAYASACLVLIPPFIILFRPFFFIFCIVYTRTATFLERDSSRCCCCCRVFK